MVSPWKKRDQQKVRTETRGRVASCLWLHSQYAITAPDAGRASAHRFENGAALDCVQKRIELGTGARQLDRVILVGRIDDASPIDVRHALHLFAIFADRAHLDKHQLALDMVAVRQVDDLDDFN